MEPRGQSLAASNPPIWFWYPAYLSGGCGDCSDRDDYDGDDEGDVDVGGLYDNGDCHVSGDGECDGCDDDDDDEGEAELLGFLLFGGLPALVAVVSSV